MLQGKKVSASLTMMLLAIALSGQPQSALGAPKVLTDQDMISYPFPHYPGQALLHHETATIVLGVTIKNGSVTDVVPVSGLHNSHPFQLAGSRQCGNSSRM
jgi:hypothetical protein